MSSINKSKNHLITSRFFNFPFPKQLIVPHIFIHQILPALSSYLNAKFQTIFFHHLPIYHSLTNILTTEKSNTFIPPKCDNLFRIIFYQFSHYFFSHYFCPNYFHSNFFINRREYITDSINQTNNKPQLLKIFL